MPIPFFFLQKFTENCFKKFRFPEKVTLRADYLNGFISWMHFTHKPPLKTGHHNIYRPPFNSEMNGVRVVWTFICTLSLPLTCTLWNYFSEQSKLNILQATTGSDSSISTRARRWWLSLQGLSIKTRAGDSLLSGPPICDTSFFFLLTLKTSFKHPYTVLSFGLRTLL